MAARWIKRICDLNQMLWPSQISTHLNTHGRLSGGVLIELLASTITEKHRMKQMAFGGGVLRLENIYFGN